MQHNLDKKGFTLIELIIVIAIISILSAIIFPQFSPYIEKARITADQTTVRTLNTITSMYRIENTSSDPFLDGTKNSSELIEVLSNEGYLVENVEAQSKDATFDWVIEDERWYLSFPDSSYLINLSDGLGLSGSLLGSWSGSQTYTGSSKDIVIPSLLNGVTITNIGQNAFRSTGLIAISFQDGSEIRQIHARAFYDNNLVSVEFPDTLQRIDLWSFRDNNLTEITLPNSVQTIEQRAFDGNDLNKITIGSNVTTIQDLAFGNHTNDFKIAYEAGGAGTYLWSGDSWIKQ